MSLKSDQGNLNCFLFFFQCGEKSLSCMGDVILQSLNDLAVKKKKEEEKASTKLCSGPETG